MSNYRRRVALSILALVIPILLCAQTPFSADSAASYLRTIAVDIGPRPMGSPAERRAMEFALAKFREFGISETAILPMLSTVNAAGRAVNTTSGTAYGILRGKTSRIIVLGGHIDSASPDFPGANDDGSGSAAVIELARVLAKRENQSTFVFALFGGEEQGMRGSRHFADNFPLIGDVVLMIQLDMTNGSKDLIPLISSGGTSAPQWLVRAAYEEASALGISALAYPTHFLTLNNSIPGEGIGSDHMPFLRRGIPAIDFTSDINDPIHTPQDTYENFLQSGLKRSGDLAYRLVERFDRGTPSGSPDRYWLVQLGSTLLFVPPLISTVVLIAATMLGLVSLVLVRRRRTPESPHATIPGLKLFLLLLIIQAFVWFSETVVEWIKGDRFPWYQDETGYVLLGVFAAAVGIWVSARLSRHLRLSADPYRYALRAVVALMIILVITALGSLELALYPAWALVCLSLAFVIRQPWIRVLLWLASPYLMVRLIFSEGFGLLSRATTLMPAGITVEIFYHAALILFFSLWSFPFFLAFAMIRYDSPGDFLKLRWFTSRAGGLTAAVVALGTVAYLLFTPSYSAVWRQLITVHQTVDQATSEGRLTVTSSDYLDGARIQWGAHDTLISRRKTEVNLGSFSVRGTPWVRAEHQVEVTGDSTRRVSMVLTLTTEHRPYTLSVRYRARPGQIQDVISPFVYSSEGSGCVLEWYAFPDSVLSVPISFALAGPGSVDEEIVATFKEVMVPVAVTKDLSFTTVETEVVAKDSLALERGGR
jgi:hypothetical protein